MKAAIAKTNHDDFSRKCCWRDGVTKFNTKSAIEIDVSISDPSWESRSPFCQTLVEEAIQAVFTESPVAQKLIADKVEPEISVVLANDDLVQELNRQYRDRDQPTNVLSFAQLDGETGWKAPDHPGPCALGDLILAFGTVDQESKDDHKPFEHHLTHLIIHGMLHLLGYDHIEEEEAERMESLEIQILKDLNITNPYKIR